MKRTPILRPLLLAIVLAAGFATLWFLVLGLCAAAVDEVVRRAQVSRSIEIRQDGTPLIRSISPRDSYRESYETLDGRPTSPSLEETLHGFLPRTYLAGPELLAEMDSRVPRYRWMSLYIRGLEPTGTIWYLVHNGQLPGAAYSVGYDPQSRLAVGYIGRQGFSPQKPPPAELFPVDGRLACGLLQGSHFSQALESPYYSDTLKPWTVYLISADQLLEIDLLNRSVRVVLESPGIVSVAGLPAATHTGAGQQGQEAAKSTACIALRTEERILLLTLAGVRGSFKIPNELKNDTLEFYQLSPDQALLRVAQRLRFAGVDREELFWIDNNGEILRQQTVDLGSRFSLNTPRNSARAMAACLPVPLVVVPATLFVTPQHYVEAGLEPQYSSALGRALSESWPVLLLVIGLAVGLAWYCYRRQQQYGLAWTWAWTVFVLLLGVPGLIGYIFHRRWPVREPCPACGRRAPRDRQSCAFCHAEFPPPAPTGTEVFAPPAPDHG